MQRHKAQEEKTTANIPWWRESVGDHQAGATTDTIKAPLLPEVRDIGEELEEEARQQALLTGNETVISLDSQASFRKSSRLIVTSFALCLGILTLLIVIVSACIHELPPLSSILIFAGLWCEVLAIYIGFRFLEKKLQGGKVVLSRTGIQLIYPKVTIGPIFWDEIAEIRPYRVLGAQYIGIVPKDTQSLAERLGGQAASMLSLNERIKPSYKAFGVSLAPLNIRAIELPMTTEAFLAQVAAMQSNIR